jgi:hypothetical protein
MQKRQQQYVSHENITINRLQDASKTQRCKAIAAPQQELTAVGYGACRCLQETCPSVSQALAVCQASREPSSPQQHRASAARLAAHATPRPQTAMQTWAACEYCSCVVT